MSEVGICIYAKGKVNRVVLASITRLGDPLGLKVNRVGVVSCLLSII